MLLLRAVSLLSLLVSGSFASRTSQAVGTGWQGGQGSVPRQQPADRNVSCARRPLTRPAVADVEVLAFDPPVKRSDWLQMDWVSITTLALFGPWPPPDDLYCHAHAHNVKIVKCVDFDAAGIANASARTAWVAQIVAEAVQLGTDGANVDIEGFRGQKDDLTSLISELSSEFKRRIPTAQVTFDTTVFPSDEPAYDYVNLAKHLDFFLPMAYDILAPPNQVCARARRALIVACTPLLFCFFPIAKTSASVCFSGVACQCAARKLPVRRTGAERQGLCRVRCAATQAGLWPAVVRLHVSVREQHAGRCLRAALPWRRCDRGPEHLRASDLCVGSRVPADRHVQHGQRRHSCRWLNR